MLTRVHSLFLLSFALLMTFTACNILGSSDSGEVILSIEGTEFKVDELVSIQVTNNYSHDIYMHNQSYWNIQQFVDNEWITVYAPIADTGPPRFSKFLAAGETRELRLTALPNYALYESGHDTFRFTLGLHHKPDPSSPLPKKERNTKSYIVSID